MARRNYDDLDESMKESEKRSADGGGTFRQDTLDLKSMPEGSEPKFYKLKEGRNLLDIIPYEIKSDKNPLLSDPNTKLKKGSLSYLVRFSVHKNIGTNNDTFVCLKNTYGKPCPICEERIRLYQDGNSEEAKKYNNSDRALYWVKDVKSGSDEYLILDQATFIFEDPLLKASRTQGDEAPVPFAHPKRGKSVLVLGEEATMGKNKYIKPVSFAFKDRAEPLSDEAIDSVFDLSEYLITKSYDDLSSVMHGGAIPTDNDDKPAKSLKAVSDEEKVKKAVAMPKDDEEEEETPKAVAPKKAVATECPHGYEFGVDHDSKPNCDDCPGKTWDACSKFSF
jgi:hypothetical protein